MMFAVKSVLQDYRESTNPKPKLGKEVELSLKE